MIALLVGDLAAAEHYLGMLLDHSIRYSLTYYSAYGRCHQGALAITRGDLNSGLGLLRAGFHELRGSTSASLQSDTVLMIEALGRAGQIADGLAAVEEAIARSEETEGRWLIAELLRIKAKLLLLKAAPGAKAAAEDLFQRALDWAHRQGALSLELRAATSLTRLWRDQGRAAEGTALLQPVNDSFTEGFDTTDLKAARALLDPLQSPPSAA